MIAPPSNRLVLSLFPGVDLLGRAFEAEGYSVVRGPDPIFGGRIEHFSAPAGSFEGIIGGPPCQDFSKARRSAPTGDGDRLIAEFLRVVSEAKPQWFLMENVPSVPTVISDGYFVVRFNLNARECGLSQRRNRCFQFGCRDRASLVIRRQTAARGESRPCCLASEGTRTARRGWSDFCIDQGLPADFDLPSFTLSAKYRAVGNGVPIPMARVVAAAIAARTVTPGVRLCVCECGRTVNGNQRAATPACRKRMERRRRDSSIVTGPRPVTRAGSQIGVFGSK